MGRPKQLLQFGGTTLLQHTVDVVKAIKVDQAMIVTGAYHDNIIEETNIGDLFIEHNESWHEGMTSSIVCGLEGILKIAPDTDAVLILMCDQPFLSAEILNEMIKTYHHSSKEIVQCQYGEDSGPPVLFDKSLFASIGTLKDKNGARSIIKNNPDKVAHVSFPDGRIDIDTEDDYKMLL
ncbi:MAG: nucleotidyltransferase family protein [Saprospiraceae bacterium]|nr:nucleotidyltransferase family protein [Saprospiraceae bacterium]MBK9564948.1 nucleotidyltransferase family protein [Saprospiraceae bacterium]MBP6446767.1 nucleotidyltransferase family protein [Saprospiraceae bacterium]